MFQRDAFQPDAFQMPPISGDITQTFGSFAQSAVGTSATVTVPPSGGGGIPEYVAPLKIAPVRTSGTAVLALVASGTYRVDLSEEEARRRVRAALEAYVS